MSENITDKNITYENAVAEIRQACYHFSDLYFHFAKVLVEEFGQDKAKEIVKSVVYNRAKERGLKLKDTAEKKNLSCEIENFRKVTDIPFTGWDKALGNLFCPYGAAWLSRYEDNPWFKEFALLYCDVNDTTVTETFTADTSQRITKNILAGDDTCDRIYFKKDEA